MPAPIGIIGGSGFYEFLTPREQHEIMTPYGAPSASVVLCELAGLSVAFLPRHGLKHTIPPHRINYRANMWALKSLGVREIISPFACGSLQPDIHPGDFVVCDQYVDRTSGRSDTFYDAAPVTHISGGEPYCPTLSAFAAEKAKSLGYAVRDKATCVVISGPRFSTAAESHWFTQMGWSVVNMTQYPEAALARELEICFCGLGLVTDYDAAGVADPTAARPATVDEILFILRSNTDRVKALILAILDDWAAIPPCWLCPTSLQSAQI